MSLTEHTKLLSSAEKTKATTNNQNSNAFLQSLFDQPPTPTAKTTNTATTTLNNRQHGENNDESQQEYFLPIHTYETERWTNSDHSQGGRSLFRRCCALSKSFLPGCSLPCLSSTLIGSFTFLLYQVVFCLAQAATITRPHASSPHDASSTGLLAKTAALGVLTAGPVMIALMDGIPAVYPATDLFLAPFLANLAVEVDGVLDRHYQDEQRQQRGDDTTVFLTLWGILCSLAFFLSGGLCLLAAHFKLANVGAFLPYSVLCGFFTTIGILLWSLGVSVDTGLKLGDLVTNGSFQLWTYALLHHSPSFFIGVLMHILAKYNRLLVIWLVLATVAGSYVVLWMTGISLKQAQEAHWFYSIKEFVGDPTIPQHQTPSWSYGPPAPFGIWVTAASLLLEHHHHQVRYWSLFWEAAQAGMPTVLALAFLYTIRSSLHAPALKKNAPLVTRPPVDGAPPPPPAPSLSKLMGQGYGYPQWVAAMVGGIPVAPSLSASLTLFRLGAEIKPPQYGSCLLVLLFYFTDFSLVQYIPKPAFSCLMVLAGLDMTRTWLIGSYFKTRSKAEWMVTPLLVILAFAVGILNAIFLGIACSTFLFAANFYRAGIVRFVGSGLTLRSTVERGLREATWLEQHADWIQILVLRNYLFFGNAQSALEYIKTMFEDDVSGKVGTDKKSDGSSDYQMPRPKFLSKSRYCHVGVCCLKYFLILPLLECATGSH